MCEYLSQHAHKYTFTAHTNNTISLLSSGKRLITEVVNQAVLIAHTNTYIKKKEEKNVPNYFVVVMFFFF